LNKQKTNLNKEPSLSNLNVKSKSCLKRDVRSSSFKKSIITNSNKIVSNDYSNTIKNNNNNNNINNSSRYFIVKYFLIVAFLLAITIIFSVVINNESVFNLYDLFDLMSKLAN
jgi:hypothetical protein